MGYFFNSPLRNWNGDFAKVALTGVLCAALLSGCIATRSEVTDKFKQPAEKNAGAEKVSVLFYFKNLAQSHGFDSIPKLHNYGVKDFDNLFRDALPEISNIALYNTYVESLQDVNNLKRRQELEDLKSSHDYTVEIAFLEESSFKQQCFSGTISLLSLTLIPMPYSWDYTITANVMDKSARNIRRYQRKATLDNWVEALLIFAYPFYPLEGKREEIYSESLHDIFRQIETEKILKK
jgi:hypothetical protein